MKPLSAVFIVVMLVHVSARLAHAYVDPGVGSIALQLIVADGSPNLGWRGQERQTLTARGRPELTLCLALIHHLVIGANIPLRELIDWLASLETHVVVEFVARRDPMVASLLSNKQDQYADYQVEQFERWFSERFHVARRQPLSSGTRILYYGRPASTPK